MGEEAGARVVLHPQERMPFPEDEGILAKPGLLTSVGVRKVLWPATILIFLVGLYMKKMYLYEILHYVYNFVTSD